MLDDINCELLSIYPGTFPSPRPFLKKPLIYNSGFHVLVRPPLPLYRVQCNNDYVAEKSKKAQAAIKKLYKAAAQTGSSASFIETNSIFQHEATNETILTKYRESQIYTKSRLRRVNKKQLIKALNLIRRKEEEDVTKPESNVSKVENDPPVSRPKLKQRSYGALKIENRIFKMKKSLASASAPESNSWSDKLDDLSAADVTNHSEAQDSRTEAISKPKLPSPTVQLRRTAISKKLGETRRRLDAYDGPRHEILQSKEYMLKEEEGETVTSKRPPLKQGNYTKIVTLKKKSWLKPETAVEASYFPVANVNSGKRNSEMLQKGKKDESNNEIDHIYRINDVSHSMRVKQRHQSSINIGLRKHSGTANFRDVTEIEENKSGKSDNGINLVVNHRETIKMPARLPNMQQQMLSRYKYDRYKTDSIPHGLQHQESAPVLQVEESSAELQPKLPKSPNLPLIDSSEQGRRDSKYRLRNAVKREERYLSLPKITPTLTIDDPREMCRNRKNNYRVSQMQYASRNQFSFVNYRK